MDPFDVGLEVVFAPAGKAAKVAGEGQGAGMCQLVVTQPLAIGVGDAALLADVGLGPGVAHVVARHGRLGVGAEPADVAHERPLFGVLEPVREKSHQTFQIRELRM